MVNQAPIGISIAPASPDRHAIIKDRLRAILGHGAEGEGIDRYAGYGAIKADDSPFEPKDYPTVRALTNGEQIDREMMRYRVAAGGDYPAGLVRRLEVSSAPVLAADDSIVAAVMVIQDIEDSTRPAPRRIDGAEPTLASLNALTASGGALEPPSPPARLSKST